MSLKYKSQNDIKELTERTELDSRSRALLWSDHQESRFGSARAMAKVGSTELVRYVLCKG